jgi:hypothetical protein
MSDYEKMFIAFIVLALIIGYGYWFKKCIDGAGEVDKDDRDF